jgi:hypothetical protein
MRTFGDLSLAIEVSLDVDAWKLELFTAVG